jgi:poly-beta-1,6-N-acetyl-D-glucosamine synthase
MTGRSYIIITPVRDEESYLASTIDSVAAQTITPKLWVIVNDGSTDDTARIADDAAAKHSWIRVIHRANRGFRQAGTGVINAFNDGYRAIPNSDWDFLVKLDGDLSLSPDYFEKCFVRFNTDSKLGVGGGTICQRIGDQLVSEAPGDPTFHVRGATKIYRRKCWEAIGGLIEAPGWDTVDEYKANMLGWSTYTFPEIKLWHHRHAGGAHGTWKNWVKNGLANYVAGYHPMFMACKCAKRFLQPPYAVAALGLMIGFMSGYFRRLPQVNDPDLISYVRDQQLRKLSFRRSLWDKTASPQAVSVGSGNKSIAVTLV